MQLRTRACLSRILFPILLSFLLSPVFAQTIRGKVFDSHTGEPLIGANVTLEHTRYTTSVQFDGYFTSKHVAPGKYTVVVSTIGYLPSQPLEVEAGASGQTISIAMQTSAVTMQEVQVSTLGGAGSDNHARRLEQYAPMVENLLSARTIELSPDITVANAMQRVSGVTISRDNSGDGRYAIIRGMDQRYNNVLVNGIKIPSPDDVYRFVPMNLFPSEMLERLEGKFLNYPRPVQGEPLFAYTAIGNFDFHLTPGPPLIGKGNTNVQPLTVVPIDPTYGATEVTPPGADLGCYQLYGTGNQH